jgi:outer membrane biosynthesis protein TonB
LKARTLYDGTTIINVMKALAITLAMILSVFTIGAADYGIHHKGKKGDQKKERLKSSMNRQISRHMYYPEEARSGNLDGKADVLLEVMPEGDVQVILIQTSNPIMKKFIERQVKKMKVSKDEVVAGEIFKYRLVFKAKE